MLDGHGLGPDGTSAFDEGEAVMGTSFVLGGLAPQTTYDVRVSARNANGVVLATDLSQVTTGRGVPPAVQVAPLPVLPVADVTVIVANGWSPADVSVAAALSARTPDAAVVYTRGDALSGPAKELLADHRPREVFIVGGPAAISQRVATSVRRAIGGGAPVRVQGADRAATAASAARRAWDQLDGAAPVLVVANGWSPPDAAAAAVLAAHTAGAAVGVVARDSVPAATTTLIRERQPGRVIIVGGPAAVTPDVRDALAAAVPEAAVERIEGDTRFAQAATIARRLLSMARPGTSTPLIVANGQSPPDIGVAAALSARTPHSAILYTHPDDLPQVTRDVLREFGPAHVIVIGGPEAVTTGVAGELAFVLPNAVLVRYSGEDRTNTAVQTARVILNTNYPNTN